MNFNYSDHNDYLGQCAEVNQVLFHYSNGQAVVGIIENKELWATDVYFQNDAQEQLHAYSILRLCLNQKYQNSSLQQRLDFCKLMSSFIDQQQRLSEYSYSPIHTVSFCEDGDDLSLWRGYGNSNGSYAIGFSSLNLQECEYVKDESHKRIWLVKCIYDENDQRSFVESFLGEKFRIFSSTTFASQIKKNEYALGVAREFDWKIAPVLKHEKFHSEKEWRLIVRVESITGEARFREGENIIRPFVSVRFPEDSIKFPIEKLIIGPNPKKSLSVSSIMRLLGASLSSLPGLVDEIEYKREIDSDDVDVAFKDRTIQIRHSQIPFRTW